MTHLEKIQSIVEWYKSQASGEVRLFKGEFNEMKDERIYNRCMHYWRLKTNLKNNIIKQHHLAQIDRAYYFNVECWPLERIRARYEFLNSNKKEVV